jgi:Spy/CpxP family protein refolding chaperone
MLYGLITVLLLGGLLFARQPGGEMQMGRMEKILDLKEEQKSQILDLHLQLRKEMILLKSEQEKLHAEIKLEITSDKFSESKLKKMVDQISDLQSQIHMKRLMNQRAVRSLLTEEQRKKFDLIFLSRRPGDRHHGRWHGPRPPRPGRMPMEEPQED